MGPPCRKFKIVSYLQAISLTADGLIEWVTCSIKLITTPKSKLLATTSFQKEHEENEGELHLFSLATIFCFNGVVLIVLISCFFQQCLI